jgi:hypothetical protein
VSRAVSGALLAVLAAAVAAAATAGASCGQAGAGYGNGGGNEGTGGNSANGNGNGSGNGNGGSDGAGSGRGRRGADHASGRGRSDRDGRSEDAAGAPVFWLKGSTHVHTVHSGDSNMSVDDVVRWYRDRGYDFIVITDHNRVTEHEAAGRPLVLRGIELTHNPGDCDPPPPEPSGKCRIHLNGLVLREAALASAAPGAASAAALELEPSGRPPVVEWKNSTTSARLEMYQAGIDKVRQLGGIAQVNHPSWHWGVDAALLAELGRRGATLVEVANMGFPRWNAGNALRPSAEALWDQALSEGVTVYGVASDDAHHYEQSEIDTRRATGRPVYAAGTGWVMVRSARDPAAIRRALARGDFYASTGVVLDRAAVAGGSMQIEVSDASPGWHHITFIGQGGAVLERVGGRSARFDLDDAPAGYVRGLVTRDDGARAWVQPVRVPLARAED